MVRREERGERREERGERKKRGERREERGERREERGERREERGERREERGEYQGTNIVVVAKANNAIEGVEEVLVEHIIHLNVLGKEVTQQILHGVGRRLT